MLRMLQTHPEEPKAGLTDPPSPHFRYDFGRVPIRPPAARPIQTKLAINKPGDEYEQEADRVAEQVMSMPDPRLQRARTSGEHCPKCQTEKQSQRRGLLQTQHVGSGDLEQTVVPPAVHEVLRSPGQPLDPVTRGFMEPRFGHDFSRVRVHSGAAAEQSARDVNANAYTVGHRIVFGSGGFTSAMQPERRLLAHELTHVLQQTGPLMHAPSAPDPDILQRDSKVADPKKKKDPKVEAAKKMLQDKFGIREFTQEEGVPWTESQLRKLDAAFAKMSPEEQGYLKSVTLQRVKKIDRPQDMERMDSTIIIVAETSANEMKFTAKGFDKNTPIHEAGHLIRFKQLHEITTNSKAGIQEQALEKNIEWPDAMQADVRALLKAATALRDSDDEQRSARTLELTSLYRSR